MGSCTSKPTGEPPSPHTETVELPQSSPDMRYLRPPPPLQPVPPSPVQQARRGSGPSNITSPPQGKGKSNGQAARGVEPSRGKKRAPAQNAENDLDSITRNILTKSRQVLESGKGGLVNEQGYMEAKILLLGSGESGKSTILKQMKILHGDGFTHAELLQYKQIIRHNLIDSAQALLRVILSWGYRPELSELPSGWDAGAIYEEEDEHARQWGNNAVMETLPGTNEFSVPVRLPGEENDSPRATLRPANGEQISFNDMIRNDVGPLASSARSMTSKKSKKRGLPTAIDSPHGPSGAFQLGSSANVPPLPGQELARPNYDPLHARSLQSVSQTSTVSDYNYAASSPTTSAFHIDSDRMGPVPPRAYGSQPTIMSTGTESGVSETVQALLTYQLQHGKCPPLWVAQAILELWTNQSFMRDVLRRSSEFYLMDNAPYFFKHAVRICSPQYWPTNQDVLRSRVQTRGVTQSSFVADGMRIHMYDVGGQRAERKKWIVAFESVKCVIFTASLSEYDQSLLEHPEQNRMQESIEVFKNIITSRWFQKATMVMFFNKMDVFEEKYHRSPMKNYFAEYSGNDVEAGVKFIIWKYRQVNKNNAPVYSHITTATDTNRCSVVLAAVRENILDAAIRESGLI